jgi:hypothetical protein
MKTLEQRPRIVTASRVGMLFAFLLFSWYAGLILWHALPPLMSDLQIWDIAGALLARHLRGVPESLYVVKHYPVPNSTIEVIPALLGLVISPVAAARLLLLIYLVIAFFSLRSIMRATDATPAMWWVAPSACFLGINFWYGQLGFLLGIAVLLFFTAALVRRETNSHSDWVIGALLTLLFLTHMVPYTFALLMLALFVLQTGRGRLLWQAAPSLGLTVWYVIGRFSTGDADSSAAPTDTAYRGASFLAFKINTFAKSFGFINPITADLKHSAAHGMLGSSLYLCLFAVNLAMCAALLVVLVRYGLDVAQKRPYLWLSFLFAIPAYLLAPPVFLGIVDPGGRILLTAVFPLLLALPSAPEGYPARTPLRVLATCSVILALSGATMFARLPWSPTVPQSPHPFPTPVERLGRVPYAQWASQIEDLQKGTSDAPIYETSVLKNR